MDAKEFALQRNPNAAADPDLQHTLQHVKLNMTEKNYKSKRESFYF